MSVFLDAFSTAFKLIVSLDTSLLEIVWLSIKVSISSLIIASVFGFPVGAFLAIKSFRGRALIVSIFNSMMGMPPVVVGLVVYLMLSSAGPLGVLGLLYTPSAMIIAQTILIMPILIALSRQVVEPLHEEYRDQLTSLGVRGSRRVAVLLWEARFGLLTAVLAGFGRAIAEVGAVMIVGGNINHLTRVMTTAIALETSKGNLSLALALGLILVGLAVAVNGLLGFLGWQRREAFHV